MATVLASRDENSFISCREPLRDMVLHFFSGEIESCRALTFSGNKFSRLNMRSLEGPGLV